MKKVILVSILILLMIPVVVRANDIPGQIQRMLPNLPRIESVRFDEDLKLYEVFAQGQVFYITEDFRHLIVGNIIELGTLKNLTAERIRALRKVNFASLPKEDAIKISDGKRAIAVFTDLECGYCRKFHQELKKLKDVSVFIYLYPLGEEGKKKAAQVWCSQNRVEALESVLQGGVVRQSQGGCRDLPIERNLTLGRANYITGTPAVITDRGDVVNGFVSAERLREILERGL